MSIIQGNAKQGSTRGFYPKVINGSLRFNDDDGAYLSWTPASAGNRKTWTWSAWVKRGNIDANSQMIFASRNSLDITQLYFDGGNNGALTFYYRTGATIYQLTTTSLYRDPSSWYHIVLEMDTTQATSSNRTKIYVNGEQVIAFGTANYVPQNTDTFVNATQAHQLGNNTVGQYLDGYLAEVHFTDGTAYDADAFGEFKEGVWVAKAPDVTYGTNGFYLTFEDDTEVEAFNTVLWRGTGSAQSITGMGFQPDLVWIKNRTSAYSHLLYDTIRGTNLYLASNSTVADQSFANGLTSFDSDGFGVGTDAAVNGSGQSFVAWGWKAGDSNVSNTDGTITSTVRANDTYGFSIVSWVLGSTDNGTIGHGLSSAPDMIIARSRDSVSQWIVYHSANTASPETDYLALESTQATIDDVRAWNDTSPTSTEFTIGDVSWWGGSTDDMIAYCWSETTGYSKFGSYTGDGTSDGSLKVTTTFKPAWIIIKATGLAEEWMILDNTRDTSNPNSARLWANNSNAEVTSNAVNFESDGFSFVTNYAGLNQNGATYIYAAFADTREAAFWLDQSGNDNDWQPVNLDHNDTVADSPTNNFATLNPLAKTTASPTFSDGNLVVTTGVAGGGLAFGTIAYPNTGKWYYEAYPESGQSFVVGVGIYNATKDYANYTGTLGLIQDGRTWLNGTATAFGSSYAIGDTVGVLVDKDSGTVTFYINGTVVGTGAIAFDYDDLFPLVGDISGIYEGTIRVNFGQQPFKYDPPA